MLIAARAGLVVLVAVVLQTSIFARLEAFDARADVVLLVAIAAGLEGGPERGAAVGFAAGLVLDLLLAGPAGLSALTYTLIGYGVGTFQRGVLRSAWWIPLGVTVAASALGVVLYAILDAVLGAATVEVGDLPAIVGVVAVVNGVLSRPFRWAMRRALATDDRDRYAFR